MSGPSVGMEQEAAYRRIWQTFRTYTHVVDGRHDNPDWRSRSGSFVMAIIRVPVDVLRVDQLARCRAELAAFPFVRVHPDAFLHVTLQELGFLVETPQRPDEISPLRLEEFTAAAAEAVAERRPFEIGLGGVNSFQDAAFLEVRDDGACAPIHQRLFELAAIPRAPRFAYLPLVTLAHYTAEAPTLRLAETLQHWRDADFGSFPVQEIEIVTLRVDESYPELESYAIVPFGD
ncbi:MAG: 2'-5' RNA ligase family protein [Thermomicrobiales bacterium]|nr:2'-5' RNA ligase family protein [Thermomicrobiales bacterium]